MAGPAEGEGADGGDRRADRQRHLAGARDQFLHHVPPVSIFRRQLEAGFNQEVFNGLDLEWLTSRAEIEAQLQAYFPNRVVAEWRAYSDLVWRTYRLITENKSTRPQTVRQLRQEFAQLPGWYIDAMAKPWKDRPDPAARKAYFYVSSAVLARRSAVIDELLNSRPAGFSTGPGDLAHDLLPFM